MKNLFQTVILLFTSLYCFSQTTYEAEILQFQKDLNAEYKNPEESPLTPKEQKEFKEHSFYPIDSTYRVVAQFQK